MRNGRLVAVVAFALGTAALRVLGFERGEAEFRFTVVDEAGCPVTNATVRGGAWWPERETDRKGKMTGQSFRALTDTNGCATVRVIVYSDVNITVEKDDTMFGVTPMIFTCPKFIR